MIIKRIKALFIKSHQKSNRIILNKDEIERINMMLSVINTKGNKFVQPSKYWKELNTMNFEQLKQNGYENFKKTIALNYFTWVRIMPWNSQFIFLFKVLPGKYFLRNIFRAFSIKIHEYFSNTNFFQSFLYNLLTLSLWDYLIQLKLPYNLSVLAEPEEGNPPDIRLEGKLISQDLINSIIEYDSIITSLHKIPDSIIELGAGYGRNAYIFLKLHKNLKYVIVDIPPALWVAEKYLANQFPERKIFHFRDFDSYAQIEEEYRDSDIVFLTSNQLELLPNENFDLVLNISSLHEMRKDQVNYFIFQFHRVLKSLGYFYLKQWKVGHVLFENIIIKREDYPLYGEEWTQIFNREARVQTDYFEGLFHKK